VLDGTLSELELRLNELGGDFLRVHRNALVARRAIRALELHGDEGDGWAVRVAPLDEWLAVSRRQVAAVRAALLQAAEGP
jgi:two-component system response regulator AlgR